MKTKTRKRLAILAAAMFALAIFFAAGPLYIVDEGSCAVVTRFGNIIGEHLDAGLHIKSPFIDTVTVYPKRVLSIDGDAQRIPTKENQFIVVDTTSRWRITNPSQFYRSFKTLDAAYNRLSDIIDSATRTVITANRLSEIVRSSNIINDKRMSSPDSAAPQSEEDTAEIEELVNENAQSESVVRGRNALCLEMTRDANNLGAEYGVEVLDIVPRQIKYSDELTESVFNRMIKERNQVAEAYRSLGEGRKAEWLGKLENEKRAISSEAYRKAEEIKGKADAEAARIYAEAYSEDSDFYAFYKSMESYKATIKGGTWSTKMDYFKYLYGADGRR